MSKKKFSEVKTRYLMKVAYRMGLASLNAMTVSIWVSRI